MAATVTLHLAAVKMGRRAPRCPWSGKHACKGGQLHYRVYRLNPAGAIVSGDWIEADSEPEARAQAATFCDDGTPTVELWQGVRKLAVLPCHDTPSP